MLILLQILFFLGAYCYRKRNPERFEQLLKDLFFLPAKAVQYQE